MKKTNSSFEVNHFDLFKGAILNSTVCNVQPSQKIAPGVFALLPHSEENLQFLKKLLFQNSDLNDFEHIQLCKVLVESRHCYATHPKDVGKLSTSFWIRLKTWCKNRNTKTY